MTLYVKRAGPAPFLVLDADGTVSSDGGDKTIVLSKSGGGAAVTLPAPEAGQNGVTLNFCVASAQTHAITAAGGFNGAGSSYDVATSAGAIGNCLSCTAFNGSWYITSNDGFTLS